MRQRRLLALTALAGALIYVNWQVYILAALTGHVLEASLGYFINPIVTVLLGVLVLRERLRLTQWIALGLAALAVLVIVVGYGAFPWIALTLAISFGLYGLVKKKLGPSVDAVSGLTLESLWLVPVALVLLLVVSNTSGLTMGADGPWHAALLGLAGVITATPLLLFAAGSRRVPLTVMGMLQFVAPILQFVIGVWFLGRADVDRALDRLRPGVGRAHRPDGGLARRRPPRTLVVGTGRRLGRRRPHLSPARSANRSRSDPDSPSASRYLPRPRRGVADACRPDVSVRGVDVLPRQTSCVVVARPDARK